AHPRNVTQIVVGKPLRHPLQDRLRGGSLVDQLIRKSGDIDVYVVTGEQPEPDRRPARLLSMSDRSGWSRYVLALGIVGITTILDLLLLPLIGYQAVGLIELLGVLLIAIYVGRGPALLAAVVSALSWNYLFITPRFTFDIGQPEDIILFILYFVIAIFIGNLTARLRIQEQQAQRNADRTMALYALAHEIAIAVNMDDVLRTAVAQIRQAFDAEVAVLLPVHNAPMPSLHPCSTLSLDEKEMGVGLWAYENGRPAGQFTDTLPMTTVQFIPLNTVTRTVGVIGIRTRQQARLSFEQQALLETFINQIALVIEREMLDEAAEQSTMLRESERLYSALLNSISHELRTPIAAITGAASSLLDAPTSASESARLALTRSIQTAAEQLNRLVENLLDMSRLEGGRLQIKRDWCDIGEIIAVAVKRLEHDLSDRPLTIEAEGHTPLVRADFVLIEQVLVNLLDNACRYTPLGTPLSIRTRQQGPWLEIALRDQGAGISEEGIQHIFEKFYRIPGTTTGGTGLGLSISKGLVEAHGGTLVARNVPEGGVEFTVRLPLGDSQPAVREAVT
ncbi:MAG: DUF4118 domain-containing protein, partial [Anaerolineae bacterium]|nr:DUF4118 domain-containing protein [Anaerolineae bacterium]